MTDTAMLVCEGACNGGRVEAFDAAVRRARRLEIGEADESQTVWVLIEADIVLARSLQHHPHRFLRRERVGSNEADGGYALVYKCSTCGHTRVWGRESKFS